MQPAGGIAPVPGTNVAFDVNDAGRVALGGSMGPEIRQVLGRLVSQEGGEYVVAVSGVNLLRGGFQPWKGEVVRLKSEYVSTIYNRSFSKARTLALVGVAAGAIAIFAGKGLNRGSVDPPPILPETSVTRRGRPPVGPLNPPVLRRFNPPRSY